MQPAGLLKRPVYARTILFRLRMLPKEEKRCLASLFKLSIPNFFPISKSASVDAKGKSPGGDNSSLPYGCVKYELAFFDYR